MPHCGGDCNGSCFTFYLGASGLSVVWQCAGIGARCGVGERRARSQERFLAGSSNKSEAVFALRRPRRPPHRRYRAS